MHRKRKYRYQRKSKLLIFSIVIILTIITSTAYGSLSRDLNITSVASIRNILSNLEFRYEYNTSTQGAWTNYSYDIEIENTSSSSVFAWDFVITSPDDVRDLSCWGMICTLNNGTIRLVNESYNGLINPGEIVTAGLSFRTRDDNYVIEPEPDLPDEDEEFAENVLVTSNMTNSWQSGNRMIWQYDVVVANNNDESTRTWSFDLIKSRHDQIESAWNINYVVVSNTLVSVSNESWNGSIPANGSISFGMQISTRRNDTFDFVVENIQAVK